MNKDKKNIIYTAQDIEQYLAGKLTASQMHAMEKAALDDSLLAEAMEGYEGMKEKDWSVQLGALRQQIAEKGSGAKIIPLHQSTGRWWKIAAAIFVIGTGTALTYILTKDNPEEKPGQQIAQTIETKSDTGTLKENTLISPVADSVKQVSPVINEKTVTTSTNANGLITQTLPPIKWMINLFTGRATSNYLIL